MSYYKIATVNDCLSIGGVTTSTNYKAVVLSDLLLYNCLLKESGLTRTYDTSTNVINYDDIMSAIEYRLYFVASNYLYISLLEFDFTNGTCDTEVLLYLPHTNLSLTITLTQGSVSTIADSQAWAINYPILIYYTSDKTLSGLRIHLNENAPSGYEIKFGGSPFSLINNIQNDYRTGSSIYANCFKNLFRNFVLLTLETTLQSYDNVSYSKFILPATSLKGGCYYSMFQGCTSLTTSPELPALNLSQSCYESMFEDCSSLTSAPSLDASVLYISCYRSMFRSCTSLQNAPELNSSLLELYCYSCMFYECSSLVSAPILPATIMKGNCYYGMFWGCNGLTNTPDLPATELATNCYTYMFYNCDGLTTTGVISGNVDNDTNGLSLTHMFENCSLLNTVYTNFSIWNNPLDLTDTSSISYNWLSGVAPTGQIIASGALIDSPNDTDSTAGVPSGWEQILP